MSENEKFLGIDVAKAHLDVAWSGSSEVRRVPNTQAGIDTLIKDLKVAPPKLVVMEATGGYQKPVLAALLAANIPAVAANPRQVRDFARALGVREKTDAVDARLLARFGLSVRPAVREPAPDSTDDAFDELVTRRRQIVDMLVAEQNRLQQATSKRVVSDVKTHIKFLKKRLDDVDKDIDGTVEKHPKWNARVALIESVPGVGRVTAVTLLSAFPELGRLDRKQIAKLAGVAPLANDSGQRTGQRHIWGGRAEVRSVLYMATLAATRWNDRIRESYKALVSRGKLKKVALVACMRKLLVILNAMLRNDSPWEAPITLGAKSE